MSTTLHLKANSRGSWANVMSFTPAQIHDVKEAAWVLCLAADRTVSFKIADDRGVTLHGNPGVAGFRGVLGGRQSQTLARVDVHDDRMIGVLDLFERLDQSEHVIAGLDIPVV